MHQLPSLATATIVAATCVLGEFAIANDGDCDGCRPESNLITVKSVSGRQGWKCAESKNFRVVCHDRCGDARRIAEHCEELRNSLFQFWLPNADASTWNPRCEIVVHQNAASYLGSVGRGAASTSGSADVTMDGERVVARRIDLRADKPNLLTAALPHEMTHVVVADWTRGKPLPLWADEGMAMLADSAEKQARHRRDLRLAIISGAAFGADELFTMDGYPSQERWPAYYAQSHAVVRYLVKRDSPQRFVAFLHSMEEIGHDKALREHYGITRVSSLHEAWNQPPRYVAASSRDAE